MRYLVLLKGVQPATAPPPALMAAIAQLGEEVVHHNGAVEIR